MAGRPLGKVAMTATERQRKWREKVRRRERLSGHRDWPSLRTPQMREDAISGRLHHVWPRR